MAEEEQAEQHDQASKRADDDDNNNNNDSNDSSKQENELRDGYRTPENQKIPKDDSFQTCKTVMASAKTRRQLRMTPFRSSILSGGTPFKEATPSGKKFNSRSKKTRSGSKKLNDTAGSNDTFIRHEQDLNFERDSLDTAQQKPIFRKASSPQKPISRKAPSPQKPKLPDPPRFARPTRPTRPNPPSSVRSSIVRSSSVKPNMRAPSSVRPSNMRPPSSVRPPSTRPRCLSQLNDTRCSTRSQSIKPNRAQSFKSTAELEREYFTSLRSRF